MTEEYEHASMEAMREARYDEKMRALFGAQVPVRGHSRRGTRGVRKHFRRFSVYATSDRNETFEKVYTTEDPAAANDFAAYQRRLGHETRVFAEEF